MDQAPHAAGTSTSAAATGQAEKTGRQSQGWKNGEKDMRAIQKIRPSMRNFAAHGQILLDCQQNLEKTSGLKMA
jgi:hypothetical protein